MTIWIHVNCRGPKTHLIQVYSCTVRSWSDIYPTDVYAWLTFYQGLHQNIWFPPSFSYSHYLQGSYFLSLSEYNVWRFLSLYLEGSLHKVQQNLHEGSIRHDNYVIRVSSCFDTRPVEIPQQTIHHQTGKKLRPVPMRDRSVNRVSRSGRA